MIKIALISCFLFFNKFLSAQNANDADYFWNTIGPKIGYGIKRSSNIYELGVVFGHRGIIGPCTYDPFTGFVASAEFIKTNNKLYVNPKLTAEAHWLLAMRFNAIMKREGERGILLEAEIGPSLAGYLSLTYGYRFAITNTRQLSNFHMLTFHTNVFLFNKK